MRPQTAMAAVFLVMIGTSVLLLRGKSSRAPASAEMTVTEEGTPAPAGVRRSRRTSPRPARPPSRSRRRTPRAASLQPPRRSPCSRCPRRPRRSTTAGSGPREGCAKGEDGLGAVALNAPARGAANWSSPPRRSPSSSFSRVGWGRRRAGRRRGACSGRRVRERPGRCRAGAGGAGGPRRSERRALGGAYAPGTRRLGRGAHARRGRGSTTSPVALRARRPDGTRSTRERSATRASGSSGARGPASARSSGSRRTATGARMARSASTRSSRAARRPPRAPRRGPRLPPPRHRQPPASPASPPSSDAH